MHNGAPNRAHPMFIIGTFNVNFSVFSSRVLESGLERFLLEKIATNFDMGV